MSEQIVIDRQLLKEVLLEMMQERRNDFKALLREVLQESTSSSTEAIAPNPLIGLFSDDPQLVDDLIADIYIDRQNIPLRTYG